MVLYTGLALGASILTHNPHPAPQVEFYLSKDNLLRDTFLRAQMDSEGFVPLAVIADFPRMKTITTDISVIKTALSERCVFKIAWRWDATTLGALSSLSPLNHSLSKPMPPPAPSSRFRMSAPGGRTSGDPHCRPLPSPPRQPNSFHLLSPKLPPQSAWPRPHPCLRQCNSRHRHLLHIFQPHLDAVRR
jgi:hypothetical protein